MFQHKQTARYRRSNLYLPAHAHADDLPVHIVVGMNIGSDHATIYR